MELEVIMQLRPVLVPITAAMVFGGCGSSTSASKSNFAKAIDEAFAKDCITYDPKGTNFGFVNGSQYPVTVEEMSQESLYPFDTLVKVGLLTSANAKNAFVPSKTYALTPAGEKALKSKDGTAFCAGHWQVKEIRNFTKPGKGATGATMSTVQFTYDAADLPKWTAVFPGAKKEMSTPKNGTADLVLSNDGWEAEVAMN